MRLSLAEHLPLAEQCLFEDLPAWLDAAALSPDAPEPIVQAERILLKLVVWEGPEVAMAFHPERGPCLTGSRSFFASLTFPTTEAERSSPLPRHRSRAGAVYVCLWVCLHVFVCVSACLCVDVPVRTSFPSQLSASILGLDMSVEWNCQGIGSLQTRVNRKVGK